MEASMQSKGKGKGLQRVESKTARQVTFSKRKKGIFNKASELCVLCDAEAAIVIMSPHERAFTFGHPSPDAVLNRFLAGAASTARDGDEKLQRLKQEYKELLNLLKDEEKKHDEIVKKRGNDKANGVLWWDHYKHLIVDMELNELEHYLKSLEKLKKMVTSKIEELAACEAGNFLHQFNSTNNVFVDLGSEFEDELGCLLESMNEEGILRNLNI